MNKGLSLVELLVAMTAASVIVLALYHMDLLSVKVHTDMKDEWYCMQSLQTASFQLNDDLIQAGCLLPQDLRFSVEGKDLFIAGVPVTSLHRGIHPSPTAPPPYYAIIQSISSGCPVLDTFDIDGDGKEDFWADLGMITDKGPCIISHGYTRRNLLIPVSAAHAMVTGIRVVPAIHYTLKPDGLYRNGQLLAEAISYFEPRLDPHELTIFLRAKFHGKEKELLLPHAF